MWSLPPCAAQTWGVLGGLALTGPQNLLIYSSEEEERDKGIYNPPWVLIFLTWGVGMEKELLKFSTLPIPDHPIGHWCLVLADTQHCCSCDFNDFQEILDNGIKTRKFKTSFTVICQIVADLVCCRSLHSSSCKSNLGLRSFPNNNRMNGSHNLLIASCWPSGGKLICHQLLKWKGETFSPMTQISGCE